MMDKIYIMVLIMKVMEVKIQVVEPAMLMVEQKTNIGVGFVNFGEQVS
jgi:hypothetical protein